MNDPFGRTCFLFEQRDVLEIATDQAGAVERGNRRCIPNQHRNFVTTIDKDAAQTAPDESGAAGYKKLHTDVLARSAIASIVDFVAANER